MQNGAGRDLLNCVDTQQHLPTSREMPNVNDMLDPRTRRSNAIHAHGQLIGRYTNLSVAGCSISSQYSYE